MLILLGKVNRHKKQGILVCALLLFKDLLSSLPLCLVAFVLMLQMIAHSAFQFIQVLILHHSK
jgi:hypothetical protein